MPIFTYQQTDTASRDAVAAYGTSQAVSASTNNFKALAGGAAGTANGQFNGGGTGLSIMWETDVELTSNTIASIDSVTVPFNFSNSGSGGTGTLTDLWIVKITSSGVGAPLYHLGSLGISLAAFGVKTISGGFQLVGPNYAPTAGDRLGFMLQFSGFGGGYFTNDQTISLAVTYGFDPATVPNFSPADAPSGAARRRVFRAAPSDDLPPLRAPAVLIPTPDPIPGKAPPPRPFRLSPTDGLPPLPQSSPPPTTLAPDAPTPIYFRRSFLASPTQEGEPAVVGAAFAPTAVLTPDVSQGRLIAPRPFHAAPADDLPPAPRPQTPAASPSLDGLQVRLPRLRSFRAAPVEDYPAAAANPPPPSGFPAAEGRTTAAPPRLRSFRAASAEYAPPFPDPDAPLPVAQVCDGRPTRPRAFRAEIVDPGWLGFQTAVVAIESPPILVRPRSAFHAAPAADYLGPIADDRQFIEPAAQTDVVRLYRRTPWRAAPADETPSQAGEVDYVFWRPADLTPAPLRVRAFRPAAAQDDAGLASAQAYAYAELWDAAPRTLPSRPAWRSPPAEIVLETKQLVTAGLPPPEAERVPPWLLARRPWRASPAPELVLDATQVVTPGWMPAEPDPSPSWLAARRPWRAGYVAVEHWMGTGVVIVVAGPYAVSAAQIFCAGAVVGDLLNQ